MKGKVKLRPFFGYYGSKWRMATDYPAPRYNTVIEPFAGSAGYALRHPERDIILIDADPTISGLWSYLVTADPDRIRALPDLAPEQRVSDLEGLSDPERALIGFWLHKGNLSPAQTPSAWMRTYTSSWWGPKIRERIARQVPYIRHWHVASGVYETIDVTLGNIEATWFVDPPYITAGKHYRFGSSRIDYAHLGNWCQQRNGQVLVCEQEGATWLPFQPFRALRGVARSSQEVLWTPTISTLTFADLS